MVVAVGMATGTVDLANQGDPEGLGGDGCDVGVMACPPEVLGKSVAGGKTRCGGEAKAYGAVETLNAELQSADMAAIGRGDGAGSVVGVRGRVNDNTSSNGNGSK